MGDLADGLRTVKIRKQVAALPVTRDDEGRLLVMLVTSRETHRPIVPKGWPMKGRKDHRAAAIEAREEAGVNGRIRRKPIGTSTSWKRMPGRFIYCIIEVFLLDVTGRLKTWREQGQRRRVWLLPEDAMERVDKPGLVPRIHEIAASTGQPRGRRAKRTKEGRPSARIRRARLLGAAGAAITSPVPNRSRLGHTRPGRSGLARGSIPRRPR